MNSLLNFVSPSNPEHRENANYLVSESIHVNIINSLSDHLKDDSIILVATQLLTKIAGEGPFKDEEIIKKLLMNGVLQKLIDVLNDSSQKNANTIEVREINNN
jgi:hypothetical protein